LQRLQLACAEGGITQIAHANGDIGTFGDQVLARIDNRHFHLQQGMSGQKLRQQRNDPARAVGHRDRQPDKTAKRVEAPRRIFGMLDFGQDLARPIEKQRAGIGYSDAARGAQEQRHPKPCLEVTNDPRYGRLRQAKFASGSRKAAAFRRAHENRQFLKPVTHSYFK